jgi:putative transposase
VGLAKKFVFPQIRLGFCGGYKSQPKSQKRSHWGSKLLPVVSQPKVKKSAIGQMTLRLAFWEPAPEAISLVAEKFVLANGFPTVPDIGKGP